MQTGNSFYNTVFGGSFRSLFIGSPGPHIFQIWKLQIPLSSDCVFFCGSVFLFHLTSSTVKQTKLKRWHLPGSCPFLWQSGGVCFQPKGNRKLLVFASLLLSCHTLQPWDTSAPGSYRRNGLLYRYVKRTETRKTFLVTSQRMWNLFAYTCLWVLKRAYFLISQETSSDGIALWFPQYSSPPFRSPMAANSWILSGYLLKHKKT